MTEAAQLETDVLILGAGPVGLTLHLALAARGIRSHLIERRPMSALQADPRVLALSHGARQLLEQIDSWPARAATAIENIHISQRGGFGRTVLDKVEREHQGQVLKIEFEQEDGRFIYEIRLLQQDGRLVKLEVDASSGQVLKIKRKRH